MDDIEMPAMPPFLLRNKTAENPPPVQELDEPMACRGVLVNMRPMKTSGKLRIEIEVEQEMANDAFEKLGKFVNPAKSRWVALAVIQTDGE